MTSAAEFQTKVTKAATNMDRLDGIVNGGPDVVVTTDNGGVPSLARALSTIKPLIGLGAPSPSLGEVGYFYYDISTPDSIILYGPKTDSGWGNPRPMKGEPGGNIMAIGPFTSIAGLVIPSGALGVRTSSYYSFSAVGGANYVRNDTLVTDAYVAANPRHTFRAPDETGTVHGYILSEPNITGDMLGAVGDGIADDQPPIQYALDRGWTLSLVSTGGRVYRMATKASTVNGGSALVGKAGSSIIGLGDVNSPTNKAVIKLANGMNCRLYATPKALSGSSADSVEYLSVSNVCFDGNGANQTTELAVGALVDWQGCFVSTYLEKLMITGFFGPALKMDTVDTHFDSIWAIAGCCSTVAVQINTICGFTGQQVFVENIDTPNSGAYRLDIASLRTTAGAWRRGKGISVSSSSYYTVGRTHIEACRVGMDVINPISVNTAFDGIFIGFDNTDPNAAGIDTNENAMVRLVGMSGTVYKHDYIDVSQGIPNQTMGLGVTDALFASNLYPRIGPNPSASFRIPATQISGAQSFTMKGRLDNNDVFVSRVSAYRLNSGFAALRLYANNPDTDTTNIVELQANSSTINLMSGLNQASQKNFIQINSAGNAGDRITFSDPLVLPARTATSSIVANALYTLNGAPTFQYSSGAGTALVAKSNSGSPLGSVTPSHMYQVVPDTSDASKLSLWIAMGTTSADWRRITLTTS